MTKPPPKKRTPCQRAAAHGLQYDIKYDTPEKRIAYLAALPDHAMTAASQRSKYYDKGTRRPWGLDMYRAVWDQVREGKTELEIAFLFKRDLEDVRAVCRIINWMMKEMKVYV